MQNSFYGVLDTTKKDIKMGEKENKKQSHSRMFLSGIFHAHRCNIKGKIPERTRVRLALSGSSTHVVIKQGNPLFNKRPTTRVEDPETSSGIFHFTTTKANGFTLIELLVVVLIIGILAAVALPQYQQAVEKSRAVQALTALRSAIQAEESYFLANGQYTTDFSQLDITLPSLSDGWRFAIGLEREDAQINVQGRGIYFTYYFPTKQIVCQTTPSNSKGIKLCESFPTTKKDCIGTDLSAGYLCYYF